MLMQGRKQVHFQNVWMILDAQPGFHLAVMGQSVESTYHKNKSFYVLPAELYWYLYKHDRFSINIPWTEK